MSSDDMINSEMTDGYRDGLDLNRTQSYRYGFLNGRDDLQRKRCVPRDSMAAPSLKSLTPALSEPVSTYGEQAARFGDYFLSDRMMGTNLTIQIVTPSEDLLKSLKVTAGCRFIAAKRLEHHDKKLTRITAFASAYVIVLTVMPYFGKLPMHIADLYNLGIVTFSIIILISSLLQYSSGNVVNAEQHHRCALELNELRRLLLLKTTATNVPENELCDFTKRYSAVLQKYSINHDDVDFLQYQLGRPEMYPWNNWKERFRIRFALACNKHLLSLILVIMTIFMIGLVIYGLRQVSLP